MILQTIATTPPEAANPGNTLGLVFATILVYFSVAYSTASIAKKTGYGEQAWMAWVPIAQTMLQLRIIQKPTWWLALLFIPVVNFVTWVVICMGLARSRGKGPFAGIVASFVPVLGFPMMASGEA